MVCEVKGEFHKHRYVGGAVGECTYLLSRKVHQSDSECSCTPEIAHYYPTGAEKRIGPVQSAQCGPEGMHISPDIRCQQEGDQAEESLGQRSGLERQRGPGGGVEEQIGRKATRARPR
jgi:hypothetical protein